MTSVGPSAQPSAVSPAEVAADITAVLNRYFDCLEYRDHEGLRDVFAVDATAGYGPAGELPLDGVDAIIAHMAASTGSLSVTFVARPPSITLDGVTSSVRSRSIVTIAAAPGQLTLAAAQYTDRLRSEGGAWRIT